MTDKTSLPNLKKSIHVETEPSCLGKHGPEVTPGQLRLKWTLGLNDAASRGRHRSNMQRKKMSDILQTFLSETF